MLSRRSILVFTAAALMLSVFLLPVSNVIAASVAYVLGPLSGQNGWDGGKTPGFSGGSAIVNTMAHAGSQSWLYNAGTNSPGSDTPFSPFVTSVGALDQGSFSGDMVVVSFAFRAVTPGDNSFMDVYEGSANRDDRTGSHILIRAVAGTNNIRLYMNRAIEASPYFEAFELGIYPANTWHVIEMTTVYPTTDPDDLMTWGQTTYKVDGVVVATQTPWAHWWRHKNGFVYAPGAGLKFTYKEPGKAGFYLDDLSFRVINRATMKTTGAFHTSFENNSNYPLVTETPVTGSYSTSFNQITVKFDDDLYDSSGNSEQDDITNLANFLLYQPGTNSVYDTVECSTGILGDDVQIPVNSVTYSNGGGAGPYTALLSLNGGVDLAAGSYQLRVCGTTSIINLQGTPLNDEPGTDSVYDFSIAAAPAIPTTTPTNSQVTTSLSLPATGFARGRVTLLPAQPENKSYTSTDMVLEIPALKQQMTIVGVPQTDTGWDVTWLAGNAGYLAGSAFPTWAGNTVITGHVWDSYNQPGPFANLKSLKYGDTLKIHAFGQVYTYEVRESKLVTSNNVKSVLKHEEYDWVTLLSCEYYNPITGKYMFRRMVRAVLTTVQ